MEENRVAGQSQTSDASAAIKDLMTIDNAWSLFNNGKSIGTKSGKIFFKTFFYLALVNTPLLIIALLVYWAHAPHNSLSWLIVLVAISLSIAFYGMYRSYQIAIREAFKHIYSKSEVVFQKISAAIIDKCDAIIPGNRSSVKGSVSSIIQLNNIIESYFHQLPSFVRTCITKLLDRVPIATILHDIGTDVLKGDKTQASERLYHELNAYILDSLREDDSKWRLWLIGINVVIQLIIIIYFI